MNHVDSVDVTKTKAGMFQVLLKVMTKKSLSQLECSNIWEKKLIHGVSLDENKKKESTNLRG